PRARRGAGHGHAFTAGGSGHFLEHGGDPAAALDRRGDRRSFPQARSMTSVSWAKQAVLAVLLFALGTFAYWQEFQRKPTQEKKGELSKRVFQLEDKQIAQIRYVDGKKSFALDCLDVAAQLCKPGSQGAWEITEPVKLKG